MRAPASPPNIAPAHPYAQPIVWRVLVLVCFALALTVGCGAEVDETPDPGATSTRDGLCPGGATPLADGTCLGEWACPDGWSPAADGLGCAPGPLEDACDPGTFALPSGGCSEPWTCPDGWSRDEDGPGCAPPSLDWSCPDGALATPGGCAEAWVCPDGWRRLSPGQGCAPTFSNDCPGDAVIGLGGRCFALNLDACGDDPYGPHDWPEGTVFVDADAPPDGDGTRASPLQTLPDALTFANTRDAPAIALAAGAYAYPQPLALTRSVRIGGACATDVVLEGIVEASAPSVTLHDLTLRANGVPALATIAGQLDLQRVELSTSNSVALLAENAQVTARRVRFDGRRTASALLAREGAHIDCDLCRLQNTAHSAALAANDGRVTLDTSVVMNNDASDGDVIAGAVRALQGGQLELRDTLLLDNGRTAVRVEGASDAALTHVAIVRTTDAPRRDPNGRALELRDTATATLRDVVIAQSSGSGLYARDSAHVDATRLIVSQTDGASGGSGYAVRLRDRATLDVSHAALDTAIGAAVALDQDSAIDGAQVRISAITPNAQGQAFGLIAEDRAQATLHNSAIKALAGIGALAIGDGSHVRLTQTVLSDLDDHPTTPEQTAAIGATDGGALTLRDVHIARYSGRALALDGSNTRADIARLATLDANASPAWSRAADAITVSVERGATLALSDLFAEAHYATLILARGDGSALDLARVTASRNHPRVNVPARRDGTTIAVLDGASMDAAWLDLHDMTGRIVDVSNARGTLLDMHASLLRSTPSVPAIGLFVTDGGELRSERARLERLTGTGALLEGSGSLLRADELIMDKLYLGNHSINGIGIIATYEARVEGDGMRLEDNAHIGALVQTGASADFTRLHLRQTGLAGLTAAFAGRISARDLYSEGGYNFGVVTVSGAHASLERAVIKQRTLRTNELNASAALFNLNGALDARDVVLTSNQTDGVHAMGGSIGLNRALIHNNQRGIVRLLTGRIQENDLRFVSNEADTITCESICVEGPDPIEEVQGPEIPDF